MRRYFLVILALLSLQIRAQDIGDYLSKYTETNGALYLQPFADAFSADFNSGLFHNARIKKKGFHLYLGVVSQVAIISDDAKYFMGYTESDIYEPQGPYKVPTILGPVDEVTVPIDGSGGLLTYTFPGGFNVDLMPMAVPQLTIGSLWGTEVTGRFITYNVPDVGKIDMWGWGIRHSIDQYFNKMPVNIAVGFYRQCFKLSDYIDTKALMANVQASYRASIFTFYTGVGYEKSNVKVEYMYSGNDDEPGDEKIAFDLDAANVVRFTIGVTFNLGPVKLFGDYNVAKQNTFAVGLGIGINER
jgi:hypothetical protein